MEISLESRKIITRTFLLICLLTVISVLLTGCGGVFKPIKVVGEWIIGFATETGKFISERAKTFAEALASAWRAFWGNPLINNVEVDKVNPLKGIYKGVLECSVKWHRSAQGKILENELAIKLTNPQMTRNSKESTAWTLAPEETSRVNNLQDQLLKVN